MCKLKTLVTLCVVFLVKYTNANSLIDPYICGQPTCTPMSKFRYHNSIIYQYDYNATVNTWFSGASENQTSLTIRTKLSLEFFSQCEGLLKIMSAEFIDDDEEFQEERVKTFEEELMAYPLRFAFHDGLFTELCSQDGELEWTLNFKRGVLSMFQNSMTRFDLDHRGIERDIHGVCDTQYRMKGQKNTGLLIVKKKDLSQCTDRYKYMSILQTVRYNFQSKYQTWPVLQSESRCQIEIDHNVYTEVECRERHIFEPFSGNKTGAMTTVYQSMKIFNEINKTNSEIMEEKKEEWESIKHRHTLLHHHSTIIRPGTGELRSSREFLKQLCKLEEALSDMDPQNIPESNKNTTETHTGEIVSLWGGFVRACRALHHPALTQLLNRSGSICPQAKKYVIDALPYIASAGSVELIKDMIIEKSVKDETTKEWLMSMAMIPRPQQQMIESIRPLLNHYPGDKYVSLAVSSMVHSYCRNSKKTLSECCEEPQNMAIIRLLQDNVEIDHLSQGNLNRSFREKASISIKSLGNIGCFANTTLIKFSDKLMESIENPLIPLQIRLHIIDAFRKTPCHETREYFLELFRKQSLDVEIRISSYLQVMRCPKYVSIKSIIEILENEKINQVESFVWSHLQNLGKSTIPSRVEKQGLLYGNAIPTPKEKPDFRKFSRNYEHGVFFDQFNAGGNYEANLIMSPQSYIPRSASLNLTVDMFGESINIMELNLRIEGFEKYIENLFTKNGPLSRTKVEDKIKSLRFMRSANKAEELHEKVDQIEYDDEPIDRRKPMLDLGMKVFGNEISYWNAEGDDEIIDPVSNWDQIFDFKKLLSGKEISYKKSSLFVDTTYSVPTGCGLPLTMNLMGTSIVNLKMAYSLSVTNILTENGTLQFTGKMHPSMAVNIAGTMNVVGGGLTSTGVRLNTRLHTSTALSTDLDIKKWQIAHFNVSIPHAKQEIFQATSELLLLKGMREVHQENKNNNNIAASTCSWKALDYAIGIKLCATYDFPNVTNMADAPYFLMAGPVKYLLSLEKVDPSANVYSFLFTRHVQGDLRVIGFSFDTPGSKTKRMFNTTLSIDYGLGTAALAFISSNNNLKAHVKYKNRPEIKLIEVLFDIDGQKYFDAVMSLTKQTTKNGYTLTPRLYLAVNNEKITELIGYLKMAQKKGVSQCDVWLEFQTKRLASRMIGYITWNGPSKGARLKLDYQFLGERRETIRIDTLISNRELGQRKDFYGELGLNFTSYPHLNFFSVVKYMSTLNHLECNLNMSSSRETIHNATAHYSLARHRTLEGFKLYHHLKIMKPYLDFYYKYEEAGEQRTLNTTLIYDKHLHPGSLIAVTGRLYLPSGTRFFMDSALNVTLPSLTPMSCELKLHEKHTNEFDISLQGVWFTGTDVIIVALYQDKSTPQLTSRRLKAVVSGSTFKEVVLDTKYAQDNRQINLNARAEQEGDLYSLTGRHITISEKNFSIFAQADIKSKTYSVSLLADLFRDTNVIADLHIDQIRDIHIAISKTNTPQMKDLKADIKWDSNRDPNQKVSLAAVFMNEGTFSYAGSFRLFYPGRLINGEFKTICATWPCQWFIEMGWSPDDVILWRGKLISESGKKSEYGVWSEVMTPFEGWKNTTLIYNWTLVDNSQKLICYMIWERESLLIELKGDYMLKTNEIFGDLEAMVNTTLKSLPNLSAVARHHHLWRKSSDTLLIYQYNDKEMMLNSSWKLKKDETTYNISGIVKLKSPFEGYKKAMVATEFMFNQKKEVIGDTTLSVEDKIYMITLDGHLRRISNSMFTFNVTSPFATEVLLSGRLGFVDSDRHAVALIETPNVTVGAEILMRLKSFKDFHIHGHIALPIDLIRDTMVTAKYSNEDVDFRIGFQNHIAGFVGIWHYNNLLDFQYLYKVYTPINGFEENGLVLKNLYRGTELHSEASLRLSKMKLGFVFLARDNGDGLLKLIEKRYKGVKSTNVDKVFDNFSSDIHIEIYTYRRPTITFHSLLQKYDTEEDLELVVISAQLHLPNETAITLEYKLLLEDMMTMTHNLNIETPFENFQKILFTETLEIILEEKCNVTLSLSIKNQTDWTVNSLRLFYHNEVGEDEEFSTKTGNIGLITQFETLKHLNADVKIHVDFSLTRIDANIDTPSCQLGAKGKVEMDDDIVDITGDMNLTSPYVQPYNIKLEFKKDFSDVENTVVCGLKVKQGKQSNFLFSEVSWRTALTDQLRAKLGISLTPVVPPSEIVLALSQTESFSIIRGEARIGSKDNIFTLVAEQRSGFGTMALTTPYRGFRNMNLTAEVKNNETITGIFRNDAKTYNVNGRIASLSPLDLTATLRPVDGGETYQVKMKTIESSDKYALTASFVGAVQFTIHFNQLKGKGFKEFSAKVDSSYQHMKEIFVKSRTELTDDKRVLFNVQAKTPLNNLKNLDIDADISLTPRIGEMICQYNMTNLVGENDIRWSFVPNNIYFKIMSFQTTGNETRSLDINTFHFLNGTAGKSKIDYTTSGFHIDLDNAWKCGSNLSMLTTGKNLDFAVNVFLPKPNLDVHSLDLHYNNEEEMTKSFHAMYTTDVSNKLASIAAKVYKPNENTFGNLTLKWGQDRNVSTIDNLLKFYMADKTVKANYRLISPLYKGEDTLNLDGTYDKQEDRTLIIGNLCYPESSKLFDIDLNYGGIKHTVCDLNTTTPFEFLPWLRTKAFLSNEELINENILQVFWTNHSALLNSTHKIDKEDHGIIAHNGVLALELSLNTVHVFNSHYAYNEGNNWSNGTTNLLYNDDELMNGQFKTVADIGERDLQRETMDASIKVKSFSPFGVHYVHQYNEDSVNDIKQVSVFGLYNETDFNLTGRLDIEPWKSGKQVKVMVIQGNQTIRFENNYESVDQEFFQGSKLQWAPNTWLHYDINILNKTKADDECQEVKISIRYPKRFFSVVADYHVTDTLLEGTADIDWNIDYDNKTVRVEGTWNNPDLQNNILHDVKLSLKHPSFSKDITLLGKYTSDINTTSGVDISLDYSDYDEDKLLFHSLLTDNSNGPIRDYKFTLDCMHPATNLDLTIRTDLNMKHKLYHIKNFYSYQKTLFDKIVKYEELMIDWENKTVHYEHQKNDNWYNMNASILVLPPEYNIFVKVNRTEGTDDGIWVLSTKDKSIVAHFNRTDEASFHLIGFVKDARTAVLDAWRDFDDITTVDVSSYIRLNHSRLLTSQILWRPEIPQEAKVKVSSTLKNIYSQITDIVSIWKDIPVETLDVMKNLWTEVKPKLRDFLNDLNDLHAIKEDLDEFYNFMSEFYEENYFYVKDITEFVLNIIDQLALRSRIESLPKIVKEIWQVMGDTGNSLRDGIKFIVEEFKSSHSKLTEKVNAILNADIMEQVSSLLESAILKYDTFMKTLHLQFIHYVETTWRSIITELQILWRNILKSFEPMYLRIAHYAESFVWKFGKEVMSFFSEKTNEITESPYFNMFSSFTQNVDEFLKDLYNNDAMTNVKKYTKITFNFINEKILGNLPFRKELQDIATEIIHELNKLQELKIAQYLKAKFHEAKGRLEWWYEYFMIGDAIDAVSTTIYKKIIEGAKTALQNEEEHRTAKTNFIFDPRKGQLLLEQKLPVPWHAFNRTPDFNEISEYKTIHTVINSLVLSNKTLMSYYYDYMPYADIYNLLPPFHGTAVMTVMGTIVTFDKNVYTLKERGIFLLSQDYLEKNFTILVESDTPRKYNLMLLTKRSVIKLDLMDEKMTKDGSQMVTLPSRIDEYIIERDEVVIKITHDYGVKIECDFSFKTCTFRFDGWYYARLGGLFGTMNNEPTDDILTSSRKVPDSIAELEESWRVMHVSEVKPGLEATSENSSICEDYFSSKMSPLKACFPTIPVSSFYDECMTGLDPCTLANAYMKICLSQYIPIRTPEKCMECKAPNGQTIDEGNVNYLVDVPNSTDVVFIIETHFCNNDIRKSKNMDQLVSMLDAKLEESGLTNNRYAVVGYGDVGKYSSSYYLYHKNKLFNTAIELPEVMDKLEFESYEVSTSANYSSEAFEALTMASSIVFRPGVSKTFILFPCTKCIEYGIQLDYSVVHQVLTDSLITLHIVMDGEFAMQKKRVAKTLYGIDAQLAYTVKDARQLTGDAELRQQVKLPKAKLGFCVSFAIETNGTIFAGSKMKSTEPQNGRRATSVFSTRVARSSRPCSTARCECHASALRCTACPRHIMRSHMPDDSLEFWDSDEIDDFIDNFIDMSVPTTT